MKKLQALTLTVTSSLVLLSACSSPESVPTPPTAPSISSTTSNEPSLPPPDCINDSIGTIGQNSPKLVGSLPVIHSKPGQVPPDDVVSDIYFGIRNIHPNHLNSVPNLIWNTDAQYKSCTCGPIQGSLYCCNNQTIYITQQDIQEAYQHGDAALAYIIAHEYAHAMQPFYGLDYATKISELEADCLAGLYLGKLPHIRFDHSDIEEMTSYAYRIGDYQWDSIHHHGTPQERVDAVQWGIESAIHSPVYESDFRDCFRQY